MANTRNRPIGHVKVAGDLVLSGVRREALKGYRRAWRARLARALSYRYHHRRWPDGMTSEEVESLRLWLKAVCYELALDRVSVRFLWRIGG